MTIRAPRRAYRILLLFALLSLGISSKYQHPTLSYASNSNNISVLTQHNDQARTGANLQEDILNTENVNQYRFGKLYTRLLDGSAYAQTLYVSGLTIGNTARQVAFVATMHNSVYAFDADNLATNPATAPLWKTNFGNQPPITLPDANIGSNCNPYLDISDEIGRFGELPKLRQVSSACCSRQAGPA